MHSKAKETHEEDAQTVKDKKACGMGKTPEDLRPNRQAIAYTPWQLMIQH